MVRCGYFTPVTARRRAGPVGPMRYPFGPLAGFVRRNASLQ